MNKLTTKSNKPVHPIGIGTWDIGSVLKPENALSKYKGTEAVYGNETGEIEAIRYSISKGQNHIDCAELYGAFYTDEIVGRAIAGLPREDLYIADKLWRTSLATGKVRATVESMLKKLGTDYLDLLYIHAPFSDAPWQEAIPQIDKLIDEGIVRQFGISNFNVEQMKQAMVLTKHPLAVNQMNLSVLHQEEVNKPFRDFCKQNSIQIVAYRPLEWQAVLANKTVRAIAKTHDVTPAQVALGWLIQLGALPIPKATNKSHIDDNVQAVSLVLTEKDMQELTRS
jgi:diketogulonate reductase-like aldo/keto reductase